MATLRRCASANSSDASGGSSGFASGAGECKDKDGMNERLPNQEPNMIYRLSLLNRLRVGKGDYTAERAQLFKGESVESIIAEIKAKRTENKCK